MSKEIKYDIFEYFKALPKIPENERGVAYTAKCPCGGTITAVRSTYNGHYHAACDKCDWMVME